MSYMRKVAKILGVEMQDMDNGLFGDVFQDEEGNKYLLTKNGLFYVESPRETVDPQILLEILTGERKIIFPPFEPKLNEGYWSYVEDWKIMRFYWCDEVNDNVRAYSGTIFRTEEQAFQARPEIYKKLTGKKWSSEDV